MFLNFEDEEKELEHQYQIIAALEIIDYKINITNKTEQDLGLLMPLFEEESENKNIKGIFQGIYNSYSKLIMNPFFDKNDLNDTEKQSKIKNSFLKSIERVVNNE